MGRPRERRLLYKFLLLVLPFLVFSIVATGVILSWTTYNYSLETINRDYRNIIRSSAGEIRLYVRNAQEALARLAFVLNAAKLDPWHKEMALTAFQHKAEEFMSLCLLSPEGEIIASTGRKKFEATDEREGTFKRALSGEEAVSGVNRGEGDLPFVNIAVPLRHLGAIEAVLWGELNLKSVWDVLEGIQIGRTGHVFITDLSGTLVGHREIDRVVLKTSLNRPNVLEQVRQSDAPLQWIEQERDTKIYAMAYRIPDLDWVIVLYQGYPEIFAYLYKNAYAAVALTLGICLIAAVIGWRSIRRFLRPVDAVHASVERIGQGDLDQKVPVLSGDEIGDLAVAFNTMTESLKKLIDREIRTAKELVHAKNLAVLGTTSSKVTHEVGNLLNNVGLAMSMLKGEPLTPAGKKALEIIEKESKRVRGFITNFLQFAKKPELRTERVPFETILKEVLEVHQQNLESRGIRLRFDWPPQLPPVSIDRRLMYQALKNLIKNSTEAMDRGGEIAIDGRAGEDCLVVTVTDTGTGIEPETAEHIFDPFFTTKGKQGTGLGLAIVKTIMEAHRGTIECRSEVGKGTSFMLRLPLK